MSDSGSDSHVESRAARGNGSHPDLSVIISTRNRARILEKTLDSLAGQIIGDLCWEVIAVDNGSTDDTPAVLDRARANLPLVALREDRPGKNIALNRAIKRARGSLWAFTDDDIRFSPQWAAGLFAASERWPQCAIFGGPVEPLFPEGTEEWIKNHPFANDAFSRFHPNREEGPIAKDDPIVPFGSNLAVRAGAMAGTRFCETIGPQGKNYAMGSETELLRRLRARGERFVYIPAVQVEHWIRNEQVTAQWMFGRSFRAGRSQVRLGSEGHSDWPILFGAPRFLWRQLVATWTDFHCLSFFRGWRAHFDAGLRYHQVRGWLYEYRLMIRENREKSAM